MRGDDPIRLMPILPKYEQNILRSVDEFIIPLLEVRNGNENKNWVMSKYWNTGNILMVSVTITPKIHLILSIYTVIIMYNYNIYYLNIASI